VSIAFLLRSGSACWLLIFRPGLSWLKPGRATSTDLKHMYVRLRLKLHYFDVLWTRWINNKSCNEQYNILHVNKYQDVVYLLLAFDRPMDLAAVCILHYLGHFKNLRNWRFLVDMLYICNSLRICRINLWFLTDSLFSSLYLYKKSSQCSLGPRVDRSVHGLGLTGG